ncbi:MAG: SCP2 sterol-binding domain-containing protein [Betaproteobacteria bacterium]|nr:SCP2 sterol-binding domain-containing protein [Betaproteobacteria bacterium]
MGASTDASREASVSSGGASDWLSGASQQGLRALLAALNHLLAANDSARASLRPHAGRLIRLEARDSAQPAAWFSMLLCVSAEGLLEPAPAATSSPSVTMSIRPSLDAGFAMLSKGPAGLQPHLRIEGDVLLAAALGELSRTLRWDVEEDLSRLTGDVIAHRIVGLAAGAAQALRELGERAGAGFARQWSVEDPMLVARSDLAEHSTLLSSLESRLASLERRTGARR